MAARFVIHGLLALGDCANNPELCWCQSLKDLLQLLFKQTIKLVLQKKVSREIALSHALALEVGPPLTHGSQSR